MISHIRRLPSDPEPKKIDVELAVQDAIETLAESVSTALKKAGIDFSMAQYTFHQDRRIHEAVIFSSVNEIIREWNDVVENAEKLEQYRRINSRTLSEREEFFNG